MSSTTSSVYATCTSDRATGIPEVPAVYPVLDRDLERGTDVRGLGISMNANAAHATGPVYALPLQEAYSTSTASGRPLKATTRLCSDGDPSGQSSYPGESGNGDDASDGPPIGPAAIHPAPSRDRIDSDTLVVVGSTSLLAEDFRTSPGAKAVDQGDFEGIVRLRESVASVRLLPLPPGVASIPIPNSSIVPAPFPSLSPA